MNAIDFEYAGESLSEKGFMVCQFSSSSGFDTSSAGSVLSITRSVSGNSKLFSYSIVKYDSPFEGTLSICKVDGSEVNGDEFSSIMRWLNRTEPHELRLLGGIYWDTFFSGSFNIEKVEHRGRVVGFNLTFLSTAPFGHTFPVTESFPLYVGEEKTIVDLSEEIGYTYPEKMTIVCNDSGDLKIYNSIEDRTMEIHNCKKKEVITLDCENKIILTSDEDHKICDDFNFTFFRLANTYDTNENKITSTLSCDIKFTYKPSKKVVF